jgi:hypothetical protein
VPDYTRRPSSAPYGEPDRTDLKENGSRSDAMGESTVHGGAAPAHEGSVSVPFVVGAAVLVGVGLTGMAYWLITFHWELLASIVPLAVGGLLLFSKGSGPDQA